MKHRSAVSDQRSAVAVQRSALSCQLSASDRRDVEGESRRCRAGSVAGVAVAILLLAGNTTSARADADRVTFNRDIRPILSDKCFKCHGPDSKKRKAKLRLDTQAGSRGVIAPRRRDGSELWTRITASDEDDRMPPLESGKTLSAAEIALIGRWIEQGAAYEAHWSFIPPVRSPIPTVEDDSWSRTAIDRFILGNLRSLDLEPSREADRVTLLRRLYSDLIGLPPTPEEVEAFAGDTGPDAVERVVDRLLASPHFGERLAVYWLDLVRYADTVGYHGDQGHHISPYRDWVIDAFNADMPFDRFTTEQLAGDLVPKATVDQRIASGYNRLLQTTHEGGAQDREYLAKYAADRVRNFSGVWMGATMGCSECHDHKYDPYTMKDFYSLEAFFADLQEKGFWGGSPNSDPTKRPPEIAVLTPRDRAELVDVDAQLAALNASTAGSSVNANTADELEKQRTNLEKRRAEIDKRRRLTMVSVSVKPRTIRVLPRGDWLDSSGEVVQPAVPPFLRPLDVEDRRATRLDLARWLTSRDHPQTARVFVNRLWYLYFGTGLSTNLDDTGSQGEWPTYPALLDHLAVTFVDSGWDIKRLVRRLVTSSVYRQSSLVTDELRERDPANRLFARQSRFRLPAETVRDNALAVSDLLVRELGGRSARPYQPAGYYAHLNFPTRTYKHDANAHQYRRGVYTHWQRQFLHPMLKAFDAPSREECTARRPVSNTPLAALTLLNDPSFTEAARTLATRIVREADPTRVGRIRWVWSQILSRSPNEREIALIERLHAAETNSWNADRDAAARFVRTGLAPLPEDIDIPELAAWTSVARALLNLDETITRN